MTMDLVLLLMPQNDIGIKRVTCNTKLDPHFHWVNI